MARFLVRVELHDADDGYNTYDSLHEEMLKKDFLKTITVGTIQKKLPPAEYIIKIEGHSKEQIYRRAKAAADKALGRSGLTTEPGIVVAEIVGSLFVGGLEDAE